MKRLLIIVAALIAIVLVVTVAWILLFDWDYELDGSESKVQAFASRRGDQRAMWEIRRDNAMIRAAWSGRIEEVRSRLADGANVNARYLDGHAAMLDRGATDWTALLAASRRGDVEMVKTLLQAGADPEITRDGRTSLWFATQLPATFPDGAVIIRLLKDAGAEGDPQRMRQTWELIAAACRGFKLEPGDGFPTYPGSFRSRSTGPDIPEVLSAGGDVNGADPEGYTALMYAANLGMIDHVRQLLDAGADPKLKTPRGTTALSLAEDPDSHCADQRRRVVVEILKERLTTPPPP